MIEPLKCKRCGIELQGLAGSGPDMCGWCECDDRNRSRRANWKGKPDWLRRGVIWLRQRFCNHTGYLSKMNRRHDQQVECPCNKCGKILLASYGLALPMKWEPEPDNAKLCGGTTKGQ
jgi:hypothetical protein